MGFLDKFRKKEDKKNLYLETKMKNVRKIRMIYADIEEFLPYGSRDVRIGEDFGWSEVYEVPNGMKFSDACKIVSYLVSQIEENANYRAVCVDGFKELGRVLEMYGFKNTYEADCGFVQRVLKKDDLYNSEIPILCGGITQIDGVADLFSFGQDRSLFKRTSLNKRYFDWFTKGVTKSEVNEIIDKLPLESDECER